MFFMIIFFISGLTVFIAVISTLSTAEKVRKNILFGVSIPSSVVDNDEIKEIKLEYKRLCRIYTVIGFITFLSTFLLRQYVSIFIMVFLIWAFLMTYGMNIPYKIMNRKLMELKRKNNWFVGEKRRVLIDTKVSRLKDKMTISYLWFLVPLAIGFLPVLIGFTMEGEKHLLANVLAAINLLFIVLFYFASKGFSKMRNKVYSKDSEINLAINTSSKRAWSIYWVYITLCNSITFLFIYLYLIQFFHIGTLHFILGITASMAFIGGGILIPQIMTKKAELMLSRYGDEEIYTDDDEYWIDGIYYNNPKDQSFMVEKRFGIGSTPNLAKKSGRSFLLGGTIFAGVIIVTVSVIMISADFAEPTMNISDSNVVTVKYPLYGYEFSIDDIEEISMVDKVPSGSKVNGIGTGKYSRGRYNLREYGKVNLYVYNSSPPYLVIRLEDAYVIYNEKTPEETKLLYEALKREITIDK